VGGELLQRSAPTGEAMNFQLLGVNHKTAPVEVRELLALPDRTLPEALQQLLLLPGVGLKFLLRRKTAAQICVASWRNIFAPSRNHTSPIYMNIAPGRQCATFSA
jgi:hypothetical protein